MSSSARVASFSPVVLALAALALASCTGSAFAQTSLAVEAMKRGFDVRRVDTPAPHGLMAREWRRRQLAAADRSQEIMLAAREQPGLLGQYLQMQASYERSTDPAFRTVFGQYLSWYQTWLGDYDGARATFSIAQPPQADDAPSPLASGQEPRPAREVILRLAQDRKAVFFNEAHSAPVTRTLTVELLAQLRAQGFDHFAAETLDGTDRELAARGYPTAASGFYAAEPIYGEMIRAAIRLGYRIVAYDADNGTTGEARERAAAESLYAQTFQRDPAARLVVNAGFGHIRKSGLHLGGASMAERFAQISGIDPLAVEQTMLIEHAQAAQDHPWYAAAMRAAHPPQPFVFVDAGGRPWTLKPGQYDVSVFFPPDTLVDHRPAWLGLGGARRPYRVDGALCRATWPCLVEARHAGEGADAIPADRLVLDAVVRDGAARDEPYGVLYLYPGSYRLSAVDRDNRALASSTITVDAASTGANTGSGK